MLEMRCQRHYGYGVWSRLELLFTLQGCKDELSDKAACWLPVSAVGKAAKPGPTVVVLVDKHF